MPSRFLFSTLLFLLLPLVFFAQKRVYYDRENKLVDSTDTYFRSFEITEQANGWVYVKIFDSENHLTDEGAYSTYTDEETVAEGLHKDYREDGTLWSTRQYQGGKMHGELRSWYPAGQLKRIERYENGVFKNGECFNEDGSPRTFTRFEQQPEYPGGESAMLKYLSSNVSYPTQARNNNISGTVVVTFVVNKDGSISDITIVKDIGGGCGQEAVRVVQGMPNWQPGMQDDNPVKVRYTLPLKFKLVGGGKAKKKKRQRNED